MAHLQYFTYPEYGALLGNQSYYSQAVRIGDGIECSGQGGWDPTSGEISTDLSVEVDRAFANINLFYLDLDEEMMQVWRRTAEKWCPDHKPLLTATGAASLAIPGMHVEIEVAADLTMG
ncbi:hypothetical protein PG991_006595 [Apiospora marii]|uniref:Uncharacterized protein n=1 Tax=Apiospora marii TaxID=335849 RepID=A0ABR1RZK4_9PEZI